MALQLAADVSARRSAPGKVQITRDPSKVAVYILPLDILLDHIHRRATRIPGSLSVSASETAHELVKSQVGDAGKVRGRLPGVDTAAPVSLYRATVQPACLSK